MGCGVAASLCRQFVSFRSQPRDLFQQRSRGFSWDERQDRDFAAVLFHCAAFVLVDAVEGVIAAFDPDLGLGGRQEVEGGPFAEDANGAHAGKRRDNASAVCFGVYRTCGALEFPYGRIAVDSDQQQVPMLAGGFQICDMSKMQNVKTAVGVHKALAISADTLPLAREL